MTGHERARGHLWVTGAVQGVGFRFFAQRAARALGMSGFARNLVDGRVEIAVEGPRRAVEEFVSRIRRGPSGSVVDDVRVVWETPSGISEFVIR